MKRFDFPTTEVGKWQKLLVYALYSADLPVRMGTPP